MRILFVSPYIPSLIRVRPFNWIRFLTQQGHEVTVAALGTDDPAHDHTAQAALAPYCRAVYVVPHSKSQAAVRCARYLLTPTPLWVAYCLSPAMEALLRRLLDSNEFDVAHVEHLRAAHFGRALAGRLPQVYDAVDCITDLQRQMRQATDLGLLRRLVSWEEEAKLRRYEPRLASQFDRVVMTSAVDVNGLQALARAQKRTLLVDVIPNGVDLEYFRPQAPSAALPRNVVFSGKMSYAPNHDAALYFATRIWPRVRRTCPDATLTIAGNGPRSALRALASAPDSRIEVTGYAVDLRPLLARASVAVCPLRIGVGIQNKILEAMAMGKAVVATPLAARALEPDAPNHALCLADTDEEFADCVTDFLSQPEKARQIGEEARRYVEAHHDWRLLTRRLTEVYQHAITAHFSAPAPLPEAAEEPSRY